MKKLGLPQIKTPRIKEMELVPYSTLNIMHLFYATMLVKNIGRIEDI